MPIVWSLQAPDRRLLERLYLLDEHWIVKGATALLARQIAVRATVDVDVYRAKAREAAETDLRLAASTGIGDWFRFELGAAVPMDVAAKGYRIPVAAYIGPTIWAQFQVDLVGSDLRMTGQPERVEPLARVFMPDIQQHGYRAYPLVDHVADKVAAMFELYGPMNRPSTRYKDLVDLVAIIIHASVKAAAQTAALQSEAQRRGVRVPTRFMVPDRDLWEPGYRSEAARSLLPLAHTLDDALAIVTPFLNPLLDGSALGAWNPQKGTWTE